MASEGVLPLSVIFRGAATLPLLCSLCFSARAQNLPITIAVDLTDVPRKMIRAELVIPVQPGPLTLLYAKWIPGEHSPSGPIDNLAGLTMAANGQDLPWQRDKINMYAFHVEVPEGVSSLNVKCDFLETAAAAGYSAGASTTASLAMLSWNEVVLYPEGRSAAEIEVRPSVKLPIDWQYGTALTLTGKTETTSTFSTVSLEQLIDSPVLAGRYFKEVPLAADIKPRHYLDLAADGPEDLKLRQETIDDFSNLVRETGPLFKSRHYGGYHFLVTLSDQVAHFGLEHHQSSDDRVPERTFLDDTLALVESDLLPHEFVHSWNGKYRRPAGLVTGNYDPPMQGRFTLGI